MAVHGGDLQEAMRKYGRRQFIDFSANINPLGPPPGVFKAITNNLQHIIHYPDPLASGLTAGLSRRLQVPVERIVLGNGAAELVHLLAHALRPRQVVIPAPTFAEYARAVSNVGAEITYHYLRQGEDFALKPGRLSLAGCDLLFVCNPNNPTGQFMRQGEFAQILDQARRYNTFVVVDESFMDFVDSAEQWHAYDYLQTYDRLFVLYSLTKFYAIPGLRIGCGVGSPHLVKQLKKLHTPWNINSLALAAAEAALEDADYAALSRRTITTERDYLTRGLKRFNNLTPFPGTANFLLVKHSGEPRVSDLVRELGIRGILIRDCGDFPGLGPQFFRIAVKDRGSNEHLLRCLGGLLSRDN